MCIMKFKIEIDKNECIGCGSCAAVCPDFFEISDDGKANLKKSETNDLGCIKEAVDICPVDVIKVTEK